MKNLAQELEASFADRGIRAGGTLLLKTAVALEFIEAARALNTPVLGVDSFVVTATATRPLLEHILDLSSGSPDPWSEAASFIEKRKGLEFHFEVVV